MREVRDLSSALVSYLGSGRPDETSASMRQRLQAMRDELDALNREVARSR